MRHLSDTLKNIGLGIILSSARFSVSVPRVHWGFGFTVNLYIHFPHKNPKQVLCMKMWADEKDLQLKNRLKGKEACKDWLGELEPFLDILTDKRGYDKMKWMLENPMPRCTPNTPTNVFYDWVEKWDDFNESYINQQRERE